MDYIGSQHYVSFGIRRLVESDLKEHADIGIYILLFHIFCDYTTNFKDRSGIATYSCIICALFIQYLILKPANAHGRTLYVYSASLLHVGALTFGCAMDCVSYGHSATESVWNIAISVLLFIACFFGIAIFQDIIARLRNFMALNPSEFSYRTWRWLNI
ncbi:hypothetical protein CDAR_19191 [Caerostris darwini]|uniref:Uncharacterized protein n=1 Tax=Caerostris darwini TaxID=1538125 RepID=A0AAV4WDB3_9ARAC|nr:hypothetical protein CDAR_19191 [Caerostris darwini]